MRTALKWGRVALIGAVAMVCAIACDSVLDIQPPKMRPGEAGAPSGAGAPDTGGSSSVAGITTNGGAAGEALVTMTAGAAGAAAGAGGEGGAGQPKECATDALRCAGATEKTPEICDASGHWAPNSAEANGDCPLLCAAGKCTVCVNDEKRCSVCTEGDASCSTNRPQKCVDGAWKDEPDTCTHYCDAGSCITPPSCDAQFAARTRCKSESCCESLLVPGGTFSRDFDGSVDYGDASFVAEISPFYLDKFEVTVGRIRQFVNAYGQLSLKNGSGKSAHIANDSGWSTDYVLPTDKNALVAQLKCQGTTWSDTVGDNNDLPVNCSTFNVAYAFCIWDGGRLPTEVEWNFAAAGGAEQRAYPWKPPSTGPAITDAYANYNNANPGPISVGSKSLGNGRWGQADLAGNVAEWTHDYFGDYPAVCKDCLNTTAAAERTERGGSYTALGDFLFVSFRGSIEPTATRSFVGFRCARDLN
jgi:sulfatase modifying factor 1